MNDGYQEKYLGGNIIDPTTGKPMANNDIFDMHVCPMTK